MDSIKALNGYGKVISGEDQDPIHHQKPTRKPLLTIIIISAIFFFILIIGVTVAALIHRSNTDPSESRSVPESIKIVCSVTRYSNSCVTSLTASLNNSTKPNPGSIFNLSLQVSVKELSKLSTSVKSLNDIQGEAALRDCVSLFENALSRLNDSLSELRVEPEEKILTGRKINDMQTWISAAMTDQETCTDGLEEMGSTVVEQVKSQMQKSKELLSNSLAIISEMHTLRNKFNLSVNNYINICLHLFPLPIYHPASSSIVSFLVLDESETTMIWLP